MSKVSKAEMTDLRDAYKFRCKVKYYAILFAYICDFSVKTYLCYKVGGIYVAYMGATIDFIAKIFLLKNIKFRKRGVFDNVQSKRTKGKSKILLGNME